MKTIQVKVKQAIAGHATKTAQWLGAKRVLVRTRDGIFIGSVQQKTNELFVLLDSGQRLKYNQAHPSVLGEGINRKRRSSIPDDELYMWKKELRASVLGKKRSKLKSKATKYG